MKYILIYVRDFTDSPFSPEVPSILPGSMFEEGQYDTLEEANKRAKSFNASGGHLLILPFYEVEE